MPELVIGEGLENRLHAVDALGQEGEPGKPSRRRRAGYLRYAIEPHRTESVCHGAFSPVIANSCDPVYRSRRRRDALCPLWNELDSQSANSPETTGGRTGVVKNLIRPRIPLSWAMFALR